MTNFNADVKVSLTRIKLKQSVRREQLWSVLPAALLGGPADCIIKAPTPEYSLEYSSCVSILKL